VSSVASADLYLQSLAGEVHCCSLVRAHPQSELSPCSLSISQHSMVVACSLALDSSPSSISLGRARSSRGRRRAQGHARPSIGSMELARPLPRLGSPASLALSHGRAKPLPLWPVVVCARAQLRLPESTSFFDLVVDCVRLALAHPRRLVWSVLALMLDIGSCRRSRVCPLSPRRVPSPLLSLLHTICSGLPLL
jgi:hypothetical protein